MDWLMLGISLAAVAGVVVLNWYDHRKQIQEQERIRQMRALERKRWGWTCDGGPKGTPKGRI